MGCVSVCVCLCDIGVISAKHLSGLTWFLVKELLQETATLYKMGSACAHEMQTSRRRVLDVEHFQLPLSHGQPSQQLLSSCYFQVVCR